MINRMNECRDTDDTRTCEIVRVFLAHVVDRVVGEYNRTEPLRILAQRVLDDIGTRAPTRALGSGDVYNFRERLHNQHVLENTQHEHIVEGLTNINTEGQIALGHIELSLCRSRSETVQPNCFTDNTIEPIHTKKSLSCKSLHTCSTSQMSCDPARISSSQTSSHDDREANEFIADDAASVAEETEYVKYEMVKTVRTSLGDVKIYCNGEIEQAEIDRITMESKKILHTRKLERAGNKVGENRTKGFVSSVGKFFRQMCCCGRSVQDDE